MNLLRAQLGSVVLTFELIIIGLMTLVFWGLGRVGSGVTSDISWLPVTVGSTLLLVTIIAIWLLMRAKTIIIGVWCGWLVQLMIFGCGFLNGALFVVAIIFGGLWGYCIYLSFKNEYRTQHSETTAETVNQVTAEEGAK